MSYDISLVKDNEEVYDDNYTYNVAPMFREAIGGNGLYEFDKKLAIDCLSLLGDSIIKMKEKPEHYIKLNPSNKWGNYEGALKVLEDLYDACVKNTHATIIIS